MAINLQQLKTLGRHPVIARPRAAYARHRYGTVLFVLRETLAAFKLHNGLGMSASLSFYAMFALIPMALLLFFLLSQLVASSDYAIVKLAIITSNLVPNLSNRIMIEVYNVAQHRAVWGAFGLLALFWVVTPLAGALRSAFHVMASIVETPSFIHRKIKDSIAVLGILLMFFLFTFSGLMLERIVDFIHPAAAHVNSINAAGSFVLTALCVAAFYRIFFPAKVAFVHILAGSVIITLLWLAMRPAFGLVLSVNPSYGAVFGGMKNLFISIFWLYYTFIVFLFGTELISTLHNREILLLRGLFDQMPPDRDNYLRQLMLRYGRTFAAGEYVFRSGENNRDIYYLVSGTVELRMNGQTVRVLRAGEYFGETTFLAETPRIADAVVSEPAEVIVVAVQHIETLLLSEPRISMKFLQHLATRLQNQHLDQRQVSAVGPHAQ